MKILAIEGQNLASLEQVFRIDFTEEPLRSSGIFAITGPTGSGKSTLLDALCLALYNKTPRTELKVDEVQIIDNANNTISQTRPSTLLRRGATEGYAQVEFVALNGDHYRSRWSVARAYRRATGKLRDETIHLYNVTQDTEEQGTKSVLLSRIVELIGLSFDQFTRTVLLAQGDFATFLRAKTAEKAQLLEKLTGTEIYATISAAIYRKNNEALEQLRKIENKIEAIPLSDKQELETMQCTIADCNTLLIQKQSTWEALNRRLDWHQTLVTLSTAKVNAQQDWESKKMNIQQADNRFKILDEILTLQQIRESYFQHKEFQQNYTLLKEEQVKLERQNQELNNTFVQVEQTHHKATYDLQQIQQRFQEIQPQLLKARELDTILKQKKENLIALESSLKNNSDKQVRSELTLKKIQTQLEELVRQQTQGSQWVEQHQVYQFALSQYAYIESLIKEITTLAQQKTVLHKQQEETKKQFKQYEETLIQAEKQWETLEKMLPGEVVKLRSALKENEPCPVCGSTHHPARHATNEEAFTMENDKLEEQRKTTLELITRHKELINLCRIQLAQNTTSLNNNDQLTKNSNERLEQLVQSIPEWRKQMEDNQLTNHLKAIKKQWENIEQQEQKIEQQKNILQPQLQAEQRMMVELKEIIRHIQTEKEAAINEVTALTNSRNALFEGQAAEVIEKKYQDYVIQRNQIVDDSLKKKNRLITDIEVCHNNSQRVALSLKNIEEQLNQIGRTIDEWFMTDDHKRLRPQLDERMSHSLQWVQQEQKELESLNQQLLAAQVRYAEREQQWNSHLALFPEHHQEDKALLQQEINHLKDEINELIRTRSTAEGQLNIHNKHLQLIQHIEKEREKQKIIADNWGRLNVLLGQSDGGKFKNIAQQYTLDTLLLYANKQLETLSARYQLQRIPDTLSLQIIDREMLDEIRSVVSLSGGESFLVSLALALGLSALSSNRMKVESLFIDEGFGSLDPQTLTIALEALECLQMQGRKIGVISHVAEMNERISTRIEVRKENGGKSSISIVS